MGDRPTEECSEKLCEGEGQLYFSLCFLSSCLLVRERRDYLPSNQLGVSVLP